MDSNYTEKAVEYFSKGYNCSQSVAVVFAEDFNLDPDEILKMMSGFGAGIGGLRETCGTVSAIVFIAGLYTGGFDPADISSKKKLYDLVKKLTAEFTRKFGTINCADLLRSAACEAKPDPSERNEKYYAVRPCVRYVTAATDLLAELIQSGAKKKQK
ncbi:C-GCAxxG-C-C family protein [Brucepastera parasyntrophica]|uniref:C-GCAxxG-C-C family protein n=1 Tax=Brucepastera parasyntrophica TaxID=2880008 RepID=UPI002109ECEE|nr:C-GCAxxG-C-C family protein [Brucepastera parasyntrophica]ULQ58933.1 C-GCAxxG-C-C family protein [Brucepastera parasyntrophica]